jgi:DNA-binding SARP family transcriptional activator
VAIGDGPSDSGVRRVWLLGTLRIADEAGERAVRGNRTRCLLAWLALHPGAAYPREYLVELLWPDVLGEGGRRRLSDVLYRLRQSLGPHWLEVDDERIALRAGSDLWVDAVAFEGLAEADDGAEARAALDLYVDDLLLDLYDDWVVSPRERLRERFLATLLRVARSAEAEDDLTGAHAHYHRLAHADPLREEGHLGLISTLAALGRPLEALAAYEHLRDLLDEEFGLAPGPQAEALAAGLRADLAERGATARLRDQRTEQGPPFVGRLQERTRLVGLLDRASTGQGGLALVIGPEGIGKTRLLDELAEAAGWRGWQIARGRAEAGGGSPLAPLAPALTELLPPSRLEQLGVQLAPVWLSLVAPLVPHAEAQLPEVPLYRRAAEGDSTLLPRAIGHVLGSLAQVASPLLLLDNVQWADPGLWALLDALRRQLAGCAALVVMAGRDNELRGQPAVWERLTAWDREGVHVLRLGGLSLDDLRELALFMGKPAATPDIVGLDDATGGNPLLALRMLAGATLGGAEGQASAMREFVSGRLSSVDPEARSVLATAAVVGYHFDLGLWTAITPEVSRRRLTRLAGVLEAASLISLQRDGYKFSDRALHAAVYAEVPQADKTRLHERALRDLEETGARAGDRIQHARKAGFTAEVGRLALEDGELALGAVALESALARFDEALAHIPSSALEERYRARYGRAVTLDQLGKRDEQALELRRLRALAAKQGDPARRAKVAHLEARHAAQTGDLERTDRLARQGIALAREAGDDGVSAALMETLAYAARDRGDLVGAEKWIRQAHRIYGRLGDDLGTATHARQTGQFGVVTRRVRDSGRSTRPRGGDARRPRCRVRASQSSQRRRPRS